MAELIDVEFIKEMAPGPRNDHLTRAEELIAEVEKDYADWVALGDSIPFENLKMFWAGQGLKTQIAIAHAAIWQARK